MSDVVTPCGTIHGTLDSGVNVFLGIPYAAPPVDGLRFAPPQPAPYAPHIDATRFGPISFQDIDPLADVLPGTENNFYAAGTRAAEDCLNLNVWTADTSGNAPVLVYIHGGAFVCGSGTGNWIDGSNHARDHGLVIVTLNYRLGLLGNLWLGDYDPLASNLALQDTTVALRWVRDNIAAFGGDPDNVTVGGESAGGMSVVALLCAPSANGLFRRALVESGHLGLFQSVDSARRSTEIMLRDLHVDSEGDVLAQLQAISTQRLASVGRKHGISLGTVPLVTDGVIIDGDPQRALTEGCARDVDLLIGYNAEENKLFHLTGWSPPTRTISGAAAELLSDDDARAEAIDIYTRVQAEQGLDAAEIDLAIAQDHGWMEPVHSAALLHAGAGGRTYVYELAWASAVPGVGAAHLIDLPFFFGNLDQAGVNGLLGDEVRTEPATVALGEAISRSVAQFVSTGDLGDSPLGPWPVYTEADRATMVINRVSHVEANLLAERFGFWSSHRNASAGPLAATIKGSA